MKRVNVKLLLALVAALVVAAGGVYGLRRFQISRNAGGLLKLARQKLEEGKRMEALQYYQRYVGLRPNDDEAYAEFAKILLKQANAPDATRNDMSRAYNTLETAVRRSPANDTLRAGLAEFQLRIGRFADAREHLDVLLGRLQDGTLTGPGEDASGNEDQLAATDPDTLRLMLARSFLGTGDFAMAAELAGEIIDYDLEDRSFSGEPRADAPTDAYVLLAAMLEEKLKSKEAAQQVWEKLAELKGDDVQTWLAMARWHRQRGDLAAARQDVERALQVAPEAESPLFAAFELAQVSGDLPGAEALAKRAMEKFSTDERSFRGLAVVYQQQGKLAEAEQVLRDGVAALPTRPSLLLMLADTLLQQNEIAEAEQTITRFKEVFGQTNPAVGLFEARILVARQRWAEAKQKLQAVRPLVAGSDDFTRQVDLYLAQCAEQLGEFDEQLEASQRVLSDNPNSLPARVGAAAAMMASGKQDEALEEFEVIAAGIPADKLPGIPQVWLPLVQLRVSAQAKLPPEKRDWSKVDALLESLQQAPQVSVPQMALLRADVLLRKGEVEAAAAVLAKAADQGNQSNPQIAAARASLALRSGGPAAAREFLAQLPADVAAHPALLAIDAQAAAGEGPEQARAAFARIETEARRLPDDVAARLLSQLAALALGMGDRPGAERLWTEAAAKRPDDVQARSSLFDLAAESGDVPKTRAAAEALAAVTGMDSSMGKVARAAVNVLEVRQALVARQEAGGPMPELKAAERTALDGARNMLIEAENERPGWNRIQSLFAEIEGLRGNVPAAIERLQRSVSLGPTNPAVVRQLVSLLYATNRIEEARRALASLGPEASGLDRLSAEVEMRAGKFDEAVALAEQTVAADSTNADELLWLGQLLERSGKKDQAVPIVERAVAAAPQRPETWLTLVSLQLAQGKRKAAEQTLDRSADALADPQRSLALAQGNEMLGRLDEAERFYRSAAAAGQDAEVSRRLAEFLLRRGRLDGVREVLDQILALPSATKGPRSTHAWARRMRAELVAQRGTFQAFQAALDLLRENADSKGSLGPEDLALEARLLAGRPEPTSWRRGITTLQALAEVQPLSVEQRIQLSQLQEKTGQWESCRDGLVSIAATPAAPPAIVALVAEKMIDHGETSAARAWLRRLQTAAPESPLTWAIEAKLAVAEGDRATAAAAARKLMPPADAKAAQADALASTARLFEELGFIKAADKVLDQFAKLSTEGVITRAAFLGRQQQTAAALDLLETCLDKVPAERLLQVAVEVVRDGEDASFAERIEPWFGKALREDPESVPLPLMQAELRDIQGRPADAEALYRELLARPRLDPLQSAIVTNNLAFHLAQPETAAEARELIDRAIAELGPHPDLLDTRGLVALAAGDSRQAVADLREATLQPTATKLLHLAFAEVKAGDIEAAKRSLEAARKKQLRPSRLTKADRERLGVVEAAMAPPAA